MPRAQAAEAFPDSVLCGNLGQPHWPAQSLRLPPPQLHAEQDSEFCGPREEGAVGCWSLGGGVGMGCKRDDLSGFVSLGGPCAVYTTVLSQ